MTPDEETIHPVKFLLHHGELSRIVRGDASLMFSERNKEIFYAEDVEEAIINAGAISEVLDKNTDCGPEGYDVKAVRNDRERILKRLGLQ